MTEHLSWSQLCAIVASLVLPVASVDGPSFCSQNDPCETVLPPLDVEGRATDCPIYGKYGQCDSSLTERWYKVDVPMVTTCPDIGTCGTFYPVWLNGTLPTSGMVTRTACKHGFVSCCEVEYLIVLKKCPTFMAYCLQHMTGCAERYCFGTSGSCPVPTITTNPVTLPAVSNGADTSTLSSTDVITSPATLSQLATTTMISASTTMTETAETPATNTNPGDTPSFPVALVAGIVCGVLTFAVVCVVIGVLLKRHHGYGNSGGDHEKNIREGNDQNPYAEIGDIAPESPQYTTLNMSTVEQVHTYSQPKQVVNGQARNWYEGLDTRDPVPQYDQVKTELSPVSATTTTATAATTTRNQNEDLGLQNPVPIYDEVTTGGTFNIIIDTKA